MFQACLSKHNPEPKVAEAVNRAIAEAVFSYVSMVSVTAIANICKTITKEHVNQVEEVLSKKGRTRAKQAGGNGIDFTGISADSYNAGNGAGTNASEINFNEGSARNAHVTKEWVGGATATCVSAIRKAVAKEIELILKDQNMRKQSGIIALITEKIEGRVANFLQPLVSSPNGRITISLVKKSAKTAFRGLRILLQ
jgi:hypothetical protein